MARKPRDHRAEGDRLKAARAKTRYERDQGGLADLLGVSRQTLSTWERGRGPVQRMKRVALAQALGVSPSDIWPDSSNGRERNVPRAASPAAVREASPAYQVTPLPVLDGFPRTGSSVDGLLWAVEQMSRTITGMVQEARRPEPPKGKRS